MEFYKFGNKDMSALVVKVNEKTDFGPDFLPKPPSCLLEGTGLGNWLSSSFQWETLRSVGYDATLDLAVILWLPCCSR